MNWYELESLLSNVVFVLLILTMICYWINLVFFDKTSFLALLGKPTILIVNTILFFILCSRWIIAGYFPLSNLYESLLFLTWTLLAVYIYLEQKTQSRLVGAIIIPVALLINGFANLTLPPEMQQSSPLVPALQSNWLMLHVSMMLVSYATLIIGSMLCLLFLVITDFEDVDLELYVLKNLPSPYREADLGYHDLYKLKLIFIKQYIYTKKQIFEIKQLKLFQDLDNWSYRCIGLGFPFLTIGIISGGVWANEAWGSYWSWDPKETWALITWFVFSCYLHARLAKGWVGKKMALLGGSGFFIIWICYLGVNFLGKGLHSYGWIF